MAESAENPPAEEKDSRAEKSATEEKARLRMLRGDGLGTLRESEYEEARIELGKSFDMLESCFHKIDSAAEDLNKALASFVSLDRKLHSFWASRDLRLSRRLLIHRALQDVGTAFRRMGALSQTLRTVAGIVRREIDQEIGLPPPGRR